jgi:hypothetical protein
MTIVTETRESAGSTVATGMTMAGTEAKVADVDMGMKTAGMPTAGMTVAGAGEAVIGTDTIATNRHHN